MHRSRPVLTRAGCLLALAVLCVLGGDVPAEQGKVPDADVKTLTAAGINPDASALRSYLKRFLPSADYEQKVAALIKDLGAQKYAVRERATKALASLAVFPRAALEKAAQSDNLEVRTRANGVLERGDEQGQRVAMAALGIIAKQEIKGLAAEVLAAGARCPKSARVRVVTAALTATAVAADALLLRRALGGDAAWRRASAAVALDHLLAGKADKDLASMLKDPDDHVLLTVARTLANRGRAASLVPLARLLGSKDYSLRWQSAEALRWLSGKQFGYDAYGEGDKRQAAAAKWLAWAKGEGQKAKLRFPIKARGVIQLFNGKDLVGWRAVNNGQQVDSKTNWRVEAGVLRCNDTGRGYLYHKRPWTDYELTVEWRWPGGGGDSGVWFMMAKPGGARPPCLEAQLLSGKAGDFWVIGDFALKARGQGARGHVAKLADSSEKPLGQWNRMTIRVVNGTVDVKVNGVRQNEATDCPRKPGYIALQTERSVIEFRRVQVRPLGR